MTYAYLHDRGGTPRQKPAAAAGPSQAAAFLSQMNQTRAMKLVNHTKYLAEEGVSLVAVDPRDVTCTHSVACLC